MGWFNHQPVPLPKTNMEPKNDGFQEESPFPGGFHFQVPAEIPREYDSLKQVVLEATMGTWKNSCEPKCHNQD